MENIGAGGVAGIVFFLWPRTIILAVTMLAIVSAIGYFL
jgi:hypothetical protein